MPRKLNDSNFTEPTDCEVQQAAANLSHILKPAIASVEAELKQLVPDLDLGNPVSWTRLCGNLCLRFGGPIDDWHEWPMDQVIALIQETAKYESAEAGDPGQILTELDILILDECETVPRTITQLTDDLDPSRGTISSACHSLEESGLLCRPRGTNSGFKTTNDGKKKIKS